MIARLRGEIVGVNGSQVTIDVSGVGYLVACSAQALSDLVVGKEATLTIHTEVREDALQLYGFVGTLERELFQLLLQVKGVGARIALDVISQIDRGELLRAIGAGEVHKLQSLKGIGKKTAERIVLELKDKVAGRVTDSLLGGSIEVSRTVETAFDDALEGLQALGFPRKEALLAIDRLKKAGFSLSPKSRDPIGEVVKEALRYV